VPRKNKVVDIQPVEESVFESAQEEDAKDDYLDTKEEAAKEEEPLPITTNIQEEVVNTAINESKDDKPQKELVKCQYCNKNMLPKSLKYSHYQNCQGFKKINKINDKTPPTPTPTTPPTPPPSPPNDPPPESPAVIAKPKPKPRPKRPLQEQEEESPTRTVEPTTKPHPRTERINLLKERYNNLIKNAFNV
jgi:hypothetical protein